MEEHGAAARPRRISQHPWPWGDTFPRPPREDEVPAAEQESGERAWPTFPPPQPNPPPTNLHAEGGPRQKKERAGLCPRALPRANNSGRWCCGLEESKSDPGMPLKPEMWDTMLQPGFKMKSLVPFCSWCGVQSQATRKKSERTTPLVEAKWTFSNVSFGSTCSEELLKSDLYMSLPVQPFLLFLYQALRS